MKPETQEYLQALRKFLELRRMAWKLCENYLWSGNNNLRVKRIAIEGYHRYMNKSKSSPSDLINN